MPRNRLTELEPIGLVGLGLMGRGIATCLLASGFSVVAYNRTASRARQAVRHIEHSLAELVREKLLTRGKLAGWRKRLTLVDSPAGLAGCGFIIETVKEDLALKRRIYDQVESAARAGAIIASNTSAYPTAVLQQGRKRPGRFIVMHWAEPAAITRYLEICPGKQTAPRTVRVTRQLGLACGKEPTVLRADVQGFISNRLMYAMMREAIHLVESGVADLATVDRSFRNDLGFWATLAGPFRWMDLTGIGAYATVMAGLFPKLANTRRLPAMMRRIVARGALGIANARGFYRYTPALAKRWEKAWVDFTFDIRRLVEKYEKRVRL
jgi:3-hydroxybutyryl-CoA dehydrogenase